MHAQDMLSQFYCWLLGNQDVRQEYADLARQALATLGVSNPHEVPIKQTNGVGPMIARVDALSSYTAYGIWLDQAYLDTCSLPERLIQIYHEAGHYAHRHHQKLVIGAAICAPLVCAAFALFNNLMGVDGKLKYSMLSIQMLIAAATADAYLLPAIVKQQEKEADLAGARALISEGKSDVVIAYINLLKSCTAARDALWWPSVDEQIAYLEALVS
jgi:hypothetical protein